MKQMMFAAVAVVPCFFTTAVHFAKAIRIDPSDIAVPVLGPEAEAAGRHFADLDYEDIKFMDEATLKGVFDDMLL